jgi:hypothetical protein
MSKAEPEPVDHTIAALEQKVPSSRTEKHYSIGSEEVCGGAYKSAKPRQLKETNLPPAHRSSYPICSGTQSVSRMCKTRQDMIAVPIGPAGPAFCKRGFESKSA